MGITQNIGASSLIKPGVIDSAAARPASPYEGQVIFQKDTDQLLVWNGTAWVIPNSPAQNPQGLELITTGTLSSTTTNFASCFSLTYDNYRIVMDSVNFSASGDLYYRFLSGTTPNSSTDYFWSYAGLRSDTVPSNSSAQGQAKGYTGITATVGGQVLASGVFDVYTPFRGDRRSFITGSTIGYETQWYARQGMTHFNLTNGFDGIQFLTNTADTVTGNVSVYGYRK